MTERTHISYLLRIWRRDTASPWHMMVVDVTRPGEHQHFATLDALFALLTVQTGPAPPAHQHVRMPIDREHSHYTLDGVSKEDPLE